MLAGYRIADRDFAAHAFALARTDAPRETWRFLKVQPMMDAGKLPLPDPAHMASEPDRAAFADELE